MLYLTAINFGMMYLEKVKYDLDGIRSMLYFKILTKIFLVSRVINRSSSELMTVWIGGKKFHLQDVFSFFHYFKFPLLLPEMPFWKLISGCRPKTYKFLGWIFETIIIIILYSTYCDCATFLHISKYPKTFLFRMTEFQVSI